MPVITDLQLKEQINSGVLSRVYFLYGNEQYLKGRYLNKLTGAALDGEPSGFSYTVFEQKNYDVNALYDFISMLPFGVNKKCAVVSDVDFSSVSQSEADKLCEAISDIPEFCTVIFYYNAIQPKGRSSEKENPAKNDKSASKQKNHFTSIMKLCAEVGEVVEIESKSEAEIAPFLSKYAAKQGSRMHSSVARYLIETCSNDLEQLINETDKLCMLCPHTEITNQDVDLMCPRTLESNVFRITDAIAVGNADRALVVLNDLFASKTAPEQILGALSASYINIYRGKVASVSGIGNDEFSRLAGISGKALVMFRKNAANYEMPRICKCLHILEDAAVSFKSTGLTDNKKQLLLEEVTIKLIKSAVM